MDGDGALRAAPRGAKNGVSRSRARVGSACAGCAKHWLEGGGSVRIRVLRSYGRRGRMSVVGR
eukprot:3314047-Pleurochrysis_carterae.AAC.1